MTLRGFGRLHAAQIADVLRHADRLVAAQLRVTLAVVVFDGEIRDDQFRLAPLIALIRIRK